MMNFLKTAIFSLIAAVLSPIASAQISIRIDLPAVPGLISTVGNDRYLITDKEEYFLVERMHNPSLLFEINSGTLIATGAEAYKIYGEHATLFPQPTYTVKTDSKEWALYEGQKKLHSIRLDPYKNSVEVIKRTGIAMEYSKGKEKLTFVHPDGKRVELRSVYGNKEKKDPKREVHHRTVFANLTIGQFYITPDHQYVYDRDGRIINLQTGEINKLNHDARDAQGYVYGSYDPQSSILKVDHGGNIRAIHLRTSHVLGEIDRTAETKANELSVYEKRNGNYYFKGTSHDTWPIICGTCFGRGSTIQK